MFKRSTLLAACAALGLGMTAQADLIDFEDIDAGTPLDGLVYGNVTFGAYPGDGSDYIPEVNSSNSELPEVGGNCANNKTGDNNYVTMSFASPVTDLSFYFGGAMWSDYVTIATIDAYDVNNDLIGTYVFEADTLIIPPARMVGLADLSDVVTPISYIDLTVAHENSTYAHYVVDNINYSIVPAPGALVLLSLAGLASRRRRRS